MEVYHWWNYLSTILPKLSESFSALSMVRVASQSLPGDPPAQKGLHWGRCRHKPGEKQPQCSVGDVLGSLFASRSVLHPALYPTRLVLQTASWRKETAQCFEVSSLWHSSLATLHSFSTSTDSMGSPSPLPTAGAGFQEQLPSLPASLQAQRVTASGYR